MPFDIIGAKRAGLTDTEIAQEMARGFGYNYDGARKAGISDQEIIGEMLSKSDAGTTVRPAAPDMPAHAPGARVIPETAGQKVTRALKSTVAPTAPATSAYDFIGRVLPESAAKLAPRLAAGAYEALKGQTDPMVKAFTSEWDNPEYSAGSEMMTNAANALKGIGAASLQGLGFGQADNGEVTWGPEQAKNAWASDPVGSAVGLAAVARPSSLKSVKGDISSLASLATPKSAEAQILPKYEKAVRPSVKGTAGSAAQVAKTNKNYTEGVYDVVEAKNNGALKIGNEDLGQTPESRLPETLSEHLDAVSQTKRAAFDSYNNKRIAAGENGVTIDTTPIADMLLESANNKALKVARPSVIEYMKTLAERFKKEGPMTPEEAQNTIAAYNSVVDWSKASPEVAANAGVEKTVAAHLNQLLDNAILEDGNPGYRADRLKYGRLAQMEKEAAHRVRVVGRAAPSSLFDGVTGALTSAELVHGLLTMNPAALARAGGMGVFKKIRNRLNSPDYQIKKMYQKADESFTPRPESEVPQTYPRPEPTFYDPTVGRRIPVDPRAQQRTPLAAIAEDAPAVRNRVPIDLQIGESTYYDPTVGATTKRKQ